MLLLWAVLAFPGAVVLGVDDSDISKLKERLRALDEKMYKERLQQYHQGKDVWDNHELFMKDIISGNAEMRIKIENSATKDTRNLVAFTAGLRGTTVVGKDNNVVFDDIKSNVGDAYNPQSGIFTCPVSANYLFFFTLHQDTDGTNNMKVHAELVKNSKPVVSVTSSLEQVNIPLQTASSNMAVVTCDAKETVSVVVRHSDHTIYGYQAPLSTFTGILLSKRFDIGSSNRTLEL